MTGQAGGQHGDEHELQIVSEEIPPESQIDDALVIGLAVFAVICGLVFAITLLAGGPLPLYGGAVALGLLAMAIAVRRYFADRFPEVEAIEAREPAPAEADEPDASGPLADVGPIKRRSLLRRVLAGGGALFGASLAIPPIASLGPAPSGELRSTAWRRGRRLVTTEGEPLRPDDVAAGGVSTVWPEGAIRDEDSAVVLVRLGRGQAQEPTNFDWVVNNTLVAYSKVCTHAGCPVGLFREQDNALFCPCHQSTFDAARGAIPTFGPTARALPQLPLGTNEDGFLVATGEFTEQVGPAFG